MLARVAGLMGVAAVIGGLAAEALAQPACQPVWTGYTSAQGLNTSVQAVVVNNGRLVVRGVFSTAGGAPAPFLAMWNGSVWQPMPGSAAVMGAGSGGNQANSLAARDGKVYAAGTFGVLGHVWDGTTWSPLPTTGLGNPFASSYTALAADGLVYFSGNFTFPGTGRTVAAFNGTQWDRLGDGAGPEPVNTVIYAMAKHNGNLYAAGVINQIFPGPPSGGTVSVSNICRLRGGTWEPIDGLNGVVRCLTVFNGEVYAGGDFTASTSGVPLNHMGRWDGSQWRPVGGGVDVGVRQLTVADDGRGPALFAAGGNGIAFNTGAPNAAFFGIARWDGALWSALPGSPCCTINAMATMDFGQGPGLYCVGGFSAVNGAAGSANGRFARWAVPPRADSDGDGLLDVWEQAGVDINCDGMIDLNLALLGCNPMRKNLLVEIDVMAGQLPDPASLVLVRDAFAAAPVSNPDGSTGIDLICTVDETGVPAMDFSIAAPFVGIDAFKAAHFGSPAERASPNWPSIRAARQQTCRYCVFGRALAPSRTSGIAELPGNDFAVTLGLWNTPGGTLPQQAGTFMHEFGHTLGLRHGGIDHINYKPNYRSVMNYAHQSPWPGLDGSWRLDYSRTALPTLDESDLVEIAGLGGDSDAVIFLGPPDGRAAFEGGSIDFNNDGDESDAAIAVDINHVRASFPPSPGQVLRGQEDWSTIIYNFRTTAGYAEGAHPEVSPEEIDQETAEELSAIPPPTAACPADFNGDGFVNPDDLSDFVTCFFLDVQFPGICAEADFNGDGFRDPDDLSDFITAFFTSSC